MRDAATHIAPTISLNPSSLAVRLLIGAGLWCLLVLVGGAITLSAVYRAQTVQLLDGELETTLIDLSRAIDLGEDGRLEADGTRLPAAHLYETPLSGRYWAIVEINGDGALGEEIRPRSLWDGEVPVTETLKRQANAEPGATVFGNSTGPANETLRVAATVIILGAGDQRALLLAAADRARSDEFAQRFLLLLIGAMIVLAGGVLVAMAVQVRVVLAPLGRVQTDVSDVREGRRTRLDDDYPAEVRPLSEELNKLLDHNREVVERARTHVGNLAHALKTPLAVLRNEASGDSPLDDVVRRQTEAMRANVEHYLSRAQAAARAQAIGARTDVLPVIEGLSRLLNRLFAEKGVEVTAKGRPGLAFRGEAQDLEEMLGNLMENGCKWATSTVAVTVIDNGDKTISVHVDDDGQGLGPDERATALQRGVRLDETAPGTGLGLSIVKDLAELYSGKLELSDAPLGGLRASLILPKP
ncbi:MAG: ATP-binding protein [Pseudomonadota bacterium]